MEIGMKLGQNQELNLKQELGVRQILEQKISLRLGIELLQKVGKFEKQILKKIEFAGIDTENPEEQYHFDILGTLLLKESEDEDSLIGQMVRERGANIRDVQKLIVESFEMQDIDLDLGTKRHVDLITIVLKKRGEFCATVSIDRFPTYDITQSPSFHESKTLEKIDPNKLGAVQRYYGYRTIEGLPEGGVRGMICKEYLPGEVLGNFTADIETVAETHGEEAIKRLAYAVGKMFADCLNQLDGLPKDSNGLNIIVINSDLENPVTRYCDTEEVCTDKRSIGIELRLMITEFERFGDEIIRALREIYRGKIEDFL